ncbi:MAG: response regulator [Candidatus Electrothrix sp. LOE2]|nr:response regulator [Candidatus Electrothrix sp. LOE2]
MDKHILLCDDDKDLNQDIKEDIELQFESVIVHSVYDRKSALELISRQAFCIAIIDLNLEGTSPPDWAKTGGVEIIKKIRTQEFMTKIIVLSGNPETELSFDLKDQYNVDKYIKKGDASSVAKILDTIENVLDSSTNYVSSLENKMMKFSGVKGVDKSIWESNALSCLNIQGGINVLEKIAELIMEELYPFKHMPRQSFFIDQKNHFIVAEIWSYLHGTAYSVYIYNNKSSNIKEINGFSAEVSRRLHQDVYMFAQPISSQLKEFLQD